MSEFIMHTCAHSACERAEWRHRNERHICSNVKTNNVSSKSVPNAGGRFLEKPGAADSELLKSSSSAAVTGGTLPVAVGAQSSGECTGAASHASDCSRPNGCTPSAGPGKSAQPATKQKELSGNGSKGAKGKKVTQSDHHEHHHRQQQQQQEQPQPQASSARLWWGSSPELSQRVPLLLKQKRWEEAQALLTLSADETAAETQFFLGICVGQIHGEAHSLEYYQRALQRSPQLHIARNNMIRSLLARGELEQALAAAEVAARLQPDEPEMHYQLGVVQMRAQKLKLAAASFEYTLRLNCAHIGALVNGVHVLGLLLELRKDAKARLQRVAALGVRAGLWQDPMQRPPHFVRGLCSRPWHDASSFRMVSLLESHFAEIRQELVRMRNLPEGWFGRVGGRAAHDHTLVTAGEWLEAPLFGNGKKHEEICAQCPVTTRVLEQCPEAISLALAGGGESLFSVLRPGTHLRAHCGSTNTRLTCHLGVLVPPGCSVRVGDEIRSWHEGKCIVFDDSWEHEVWHRGDTDRVVLLINFWHPDLPQSERRIAIDTSHGYEPI